MPHIKQLLSAHVRWCAGKYVMLVLTYMSCGVDAVSSSLRHFPISCETCAESLTSPLAPGISPLYPASEGAPTEARTAVTERSLVQGQDGRIYARQVHVTFTPSESDLHSRKVL